MNIKDFFANRESPPELYWSLVLEPGWVQAGIWYIGEGEAKVVSVSPPAPWEMDGELTGAVDAALSSAVQKLPEDSHEPEKTVFGVSSSWVKDGEITEEYLAKIKKLCGELSLTPVGFVVLPEAIAHLFKSEEGSPLSAVVLGLGKESLEISVFKLGNLVGTSQVARSVSIIEDVTEGLSRFEGASPLPSRFIVYDGKGAELSEARESLTKETWEGAEKINFLHPPKIEEFASDRKVLAASLAGANEISQVSKISIGGISESKEALEQKAPDVVPPVKSDLSPEDLGFALGEDITKEKREETEESEGSMPKPAVKPQPFNPSPPQFPESTKGAANYLQKIKTFFAGFWNKIFSMLSAPSKPSAMGGKSYTKIGIIIGVVSMAFGLFWWFYPKAKVTIYVTPQTYQQEVGIKFSTEGDFDIDSATIPAEAISTEVSGDKTTSTTGVKTVGDKAKGSVRVQNGTAFPINLTVGTFLVSSGNLSFALDDSASVSAAISPSSPGTTDVAVTADAIGAEYNVAKDEIFKVGNYPKAEVDGTATADFSGGSSQEISAVASGDQTKLTEELTEELTQNAKDELFLEVADDQIFVDDLADLSISSENFDHNVGEEAENLKLSLAIDATGLAADREKLWEYTKQELESKVPSGFVLRDTQISYKFSFDSQEDPIYNYTVGLNANFLPQTDTTDIVKKIIGKTPSVTEKYLSSVPGFTRAEITRNVRLPGFLGTLPHIARNITIEIVAER